MIIHLKSSVLFKIEPAKRFAREYDVAEDIWIKIWLKHKVYDFTEDELHEYTEFKCGKQIPKRTIKRWIQRTEVYSRARDVMKLGGTTVVSSFFGELEEFVIKELLQNMRFNGKKSSRSII